MKRGRELASKATSLHCLSGFLASIIPTIPLWLWKETDDCLSCFLSFFSSFVWALVSIWDRWRRTHPHACTIPSMPLRDFSDVAMVNKKVCVCVCVCWSWPGKFQASQTSLTRLHITTVSLCHNKITLNFHPAQWYPIWLDTSQLVCWRQSPWPRNGSCEPEPGTWSALCASTGSWCQWV